MGRAYFEHGRALEEASAFGDAAIAYSKAASLSPGAPFAADAEAGYYLSLSKALAAEGKSASAMRRRAQTMEAAIPKEQRTRSRSAASVAPRGTWMLYAGVGGGAGALILFILGLAVKRR
jgi:hypothetical protein